MNVDDVLALEQVAEGDARYHCRAAPVDDVAQSIFGNRVEVRTSARVDMDGLRAVLPAGHFDDDFDAAGNLIERDRSGFTWAILSV